MESIEERLYAKMFKNYLTEIDMIFLLQKHWKDVSAKFVYNKQEGRFWLLCQVKSMR